MAGTGSGTWIFSVYSFFFIYISLHLWHAFKAYTRAFVVLSHSKKYGSGNLMRCYQQESELVYFWKNLWLAYWIYTRTLQPPSPPPSAFVFYLERFR
jgi:hypothetical protein